MKAIGDKAYSRREQLLRQQCQGLRHTIRMLRQRLSRQERYNALLVEFITASKGTSIEHLSPRRLSAIQRRREIGRQLHQRRIEKHLHQLYQKGSAHEDVSADG